jgi:Ca-activated chloride channel homolog
VCDGKPVLRVAVAPEFAPVVEKAAKELSGAPNGASGGSSSASSGTGGTGSGSGCDQVDVQAQAPADTLAQLASNPPDVWIPASSAWLALAAPKQAATPSTAASGGAAAAGTPDANSGAPASPGAPNGAATGGPTLGPSAGAPGGGQPIGPFAGNPVSLARSPIVVAAPKAYAQAAGWPGKQLSWAELTAAVANNQVPRFSMGNPLKDTAALLAVLGESSAMARTTPDPGIAEMRALTLRARLADADTGAADLFKKAGAADPAKAATDAGLFPATEQQLYTYQKENHAVPMVGIYPPDGLLEADYPMAVSTKATGDPARRELATKLSDAIRAKQFIPALTDQGFRPSAQTASTAGADIALAPKADGLVEQYAAPMPLPAQAGQLTDAIGAWAGYKKLNFQVLLLVDGSGSMNDQVKDKSGNVTTKAGLLRQSGSQAAQLFGEETSLGEWLFGTPTPTSPAFQVALPFGPIEEPINGVPRRQVMQQVAEAYQAIPNAGTPLYQTVLDGVTDMKKRVKPDTVTMVVVLTDGRDESSPFTMTQQQFTQKLTALRDPKRPVPVFAIGYGSDADMGALNSMAQLTGGRAVASNDPGDLASAVAKIFLAAHLQK